MSRALFAAALLALVAAVPASAQGVAGAKIAYINSQIILEQAPGAQQAAEQFDRDMARYRSEVEGLGQQLEQLIQQYQQQQLTLSPEAKANREEEIRLKQGQYNQRLQELDQQAGLRQQELVQPIMDNITEVIEALRQEGNYALIFDVAAQSIVAADESLDLTQEVVRRLQEAAPDSPSKQD
jgi:outer membrane protein